MNRPSEIVVLAEDAMHQSFIRQYLYRLGYKVHQIRFRAVAMGRGCGEQLVRKHYANEVQAFRRRSVRAATSLVVVIDGDLSNRRKEQLQKLLEENELDPRTGSEQIVHFIPKRNIEDWIHCLNGKSVDEEAHDKKWADLGPQVKPVAATFHNWTRPNAPVPNHCIRSLRQAIPEAQRLES